MTPKWCPSPGNNVGSFVYRCWCVPLITWTISLQLLSACLTKSIFNQGDWNRVVVGLLWFPKLNHSAKVAPCVQRVKFPKQLFAWLPNLMASFCWVTLFGVTIALPCFPGIVWGPAQQKSVRHMLYMLLRSCTMQKRNAAAGLFSRNWSFLV